MIPEDPQPTSSATLPEFETPEFPIVKSFQLFLIKRYRLVRGIMLTIVLIFFSSLWFHFEWTMHKKQAMLRYGSTFNIASGGKLGGNAVYNSKQEDVLFRISNYTPKPVNFSYASYYMVMRNGRQYPLAMRQIKTIKYSKENRGYILGPNTGKPGLSVRCDLGSYGSAFRGRGIDPKAVRGFRIVLHNRKEILFGYEKISFGQKIKRFMLLQQKKRK